MRLRLALALAALLLAPAAAAQVPCVDGTADGYACYGLDLLSSVARGDLGPAVAVLGVYPWTDAQTGREYALVALDDLALTVVDVTDPAAPAVVARFVFDHYALSPSFEVVTVGDWAFAAHDRSGGVRVVDLGRIRGLSGPPPVLSADTAYTVRSGATELAAVPEADLVVATGEANVLGECGRGLHLVDVSDPLGPSFAGCAGTPDDALDVDCATYAGPDAEHAGKAVCVATDATGLTVFDVSDPASTAVLGAVPWGADVGDRVALSASQRFAFAALDGPSGTRLLTVDLADLDAPVLSDVADDGAGPEPQDLAVDVNGRVLLTSALGGLRAFEANAAGALTLTAFFDGTSTAPGSRRRTSAGLPSGTLLTTDIRGGLYVLGPNGAPPPDTAPEVAVDPTAIARTLRAPQTAAVPVTVRNDGAGLLEYAVEAPGGEPWLGLDGAVAGALLADEQATVQVLLDPAGLEAGTYTADVVVASNDPDAPAVTVSVTLTAGPAGTAQVTPEALALTLAPGETEIVPLTVRNVGAGPLTFTTTVDGSKSGPYALRTDEDPDGPDVDFSIIVRPENRVPLTGYPSQARIDLPFAFPFYGEVYDEVWVSETGFLSFEPFSESEAFSYFCRTDETDVNAVIGVLCIVDLYEHSGGLYAAELPDGRFAVQYHAFRVFSEEWLGPNTVEAILSPDGTVEVQFGAVHWAPGADVFVEAPDGYNRLDVSSAFISERLGDQEGHAAVRFDKKWVWTTGPDAWIVQPGADFTVNLWVDASTLPPGTYESTVEIRSTDAANPVVEVPVTLTVAGDGTVSLVVDGPRGAYYVGPPAEGVTVDDLAAQNLVRGVPGLDPAASPTLWTEFDAGTGEWAVGLGAGDALPLGQAVRWRLFDRDGIEGPAGSESRAHPFTLSTDLPPNTADVVVELQTDGTRFNHLANPFGVGLDLSDHQSWPGAHGVKSPLFTYDPVSRAWEPAPAVLGPWEAFRFRARGPRRNGSPRYLVIPESARVPAGASGPAAAREASRPALSFRLEGLDAAGAPLADGMLTVAFADSAHAAFSADEDVEKFQPPSEAYALLGARVGGAWLGLDARPWAPAEVPLALEARGAGGAFRLSWDASALPAGLPVVLVDLRTGEEVDVRAASAYAFRAASRPALDAVPTADLADGAAAEDRFVLRIGDALASEAAVTELGLEAPRPNPTAGAARVAFALPEAGPVRLAVYDARGREVAVLAEGDVEAGRHEAVLEASGLAAGVYVVRLEAGGAVLTRRATVVR